MSKGRSLELFFVDGQPDGMLTAEVFNWTGHVLRIPRTQLAQGLKRSEARQTGVYILMGTTPEGDLAYIGETEDMAQRLAQHAKTKDWWEQAVLVTTAGDALHKAHVKYLESRLVEIAKGADQVKLENANIPPRSSLNEAAKANMESFLDTLQMVFPAIRVDLFTTSERPPTSTEQSADVPTESREFTLVQAKRGIAARAVLAEGKMLVLSGSSVSPNWVGDPKHAQGYQSHYKNLFDKGVFKTTGDKAVSTVDYEFASPSAAAAIVLGRAANGRTEWKLPDGRTYSDWESDQLDRDVEG